MVREKYTGKKKKNKATEIEAKAKSQKLRYNVILGLILAYTFFLFAKSINYEFILWDDNSYILDNYLIRDFSFKGFKNIFSTPVIGMYNPLTFVLYTFLYKFWALDSRPYNLVNIILHLLAVLATFKFIYALTKRYETATIVALLFALHPMHATVVTWNSETKTSLYSVFYLFALINYIKYIRNNYQVKYLIYTGCLFLLSVLSKPSAVTLAPMMLLIDYYLSRKIDRRLILEKIPFFTIALFFGVLTMLTHMSAHDSIFESQVNYSLVNNLLVSNYSVAFYLNKIFLPTGLCAIYPYPENAALLPFKYYLSILTIPFVLWLIYKSGPFRKEMIFGTLFFVITISVVLRIVPSGFFRASNVYTYMSYTGFFFILGQFFTYVIDGRLVYAKKIKNYVISFLAFLVIFYSWESSARISVWQNSINLFSDIIEKKPKFALAYNNRALAKLDEGDVRGALNDMTKAIELDPKYAAAYNNRGKIEVDLKEYDIALQNLNTALTLDPKYGEAYINRGNVKFYYKNYDEALSDYDSAIKYVPKFEVAYRNKGKIESIKKDNDAALKDLDKALSINPYYFDAYLDKANIMFTEGSLEDALKNYNAAIKINPNSGEAYNNRSVTRMILKDTLGASEDGEKAAELGFVKNP